MPEHWTWLFVEKASGRCTICEKTVKSASATNNATHLLNKHEISPTSAAVEERKREIAGTVSIKVALSKEDTEKKFLDYCLAFAIPLSRVESGLFQEIHQCAPKSRVTMRKRLLEHSVLRHKAAVEKLRGKTVTIAYDSGTIWRNKYLCVAILSHGLPPLIYELFEGESHTAEWIHEQLSGVVESLLKHDVHPACLASDNAANMMSVSRAAQFFSQRCAAHSLQLAVSDALARPGLFEIWESAREVLRRNNVPEPPITRWSGKYLALKKIRTSNLLVDTLSATQLGKMHQLESVLEPFYAGTQLVQANGATMHLCARVVAHLLALRGPAGSCVQELAKATRGRARFLVTDAVLLTCFFQPNLPRHRIDNVVKERIAALVRGPVRTLVGPEVVDEWLRFKAMPPLATQSTEYETLDGYSAFWMAQANSFPKLACAISVCSRMNPTEAECERAFSCLKFAINRFRTNSDAELAAASVKGMSAIQFLRNEPFAEDAIDTEMPATEDEQEAHVDQPSQFKQLSVEAAALVIDTWATFTKEALPTERAVRRPPVDDSRCGRCGSAFEEHDDPNNIQCVQCRRWFVYCCVNLAPEDTAVIELLPEPGWLCPACRNTYIIS